MRAIFVFALFVVIAAPALAQSGRAYEDDAGMTISTCADCGDDAFGGGIVAGLCLAPFVIGIHRALMQRNRLIVPRLGALRLLR